MLSFRKPESDKSVKYIEQTNLKVPIRFLETFDFIFRAFMAGGLELASLGRFIYKIAISLKGVHPIIFVSNIFPNSQLIQKCIYYQQLFQNSN